MQPINTSTDKFIDEIALKVGDELFKDFPRKVYNQAVFRAQRELARKYGIVERKWTHTTTETEAERTNSIDLNELSYNADIYLDVNEVRYSKVNELSQPEIVNQTEPVTSIERDRFEEANLREYVIRYDGDRYTLDYTNKEEGDELVLIYKADVTSESDYDLSGDNFQAILPNKFDEEIIRMGILYIAKVGIARFRAEKSDKYTKAYRLHSRPSRGTKTELEKDRQFISIEPFKFP